MRGHDLNRARQVVVSIALTLLSLCIAGLAGGCKSNSKSFSSQSPSAPATPAQLRGLAMISADGYINDTFQALDALATKTKDPELSLWAQSQCVGIGYACITNATGPNDAGSMLDMMVYSRLKRYAMADHWVPDLLHEQDGKPVLQAFQTADDQVWADAAKVLTAPQVQQMQTLIDQWRATHPGQYYVADVRFTDFEVVNQINKNSAQLKLPGNIFGLLYLDPFSGLDPVAAELKSYRDLTERMMYAAVRVPRLMGRQVNLQVRYALRDPQVLSFVNSTDRFSNATSKFSDTVANFPEDFAANSKAAIAQALKGVTTEREAALAQAFTGIKTERQGAIDQANAAVSAQRAAIVKELDAHESKLAAMVEDVKGVLARADQAGKSINAATTQTVTLTETATQRTLDRAFALALTLILVLLLGIPLVLLVYRMLSRRLAGPIEAGR
jgi:hypothetical protein